MTAPYKIFGNITCGKTLDQFYSALKQPYVVQGALMPDAHLGYGLPIGGVMACRGHIVPAWIGYDIGCGVCAVPTTFKKEAIQQWQDEVFDSIYEYIPTGFKHQRESIAFMEPADVSMVVNAQDYNRQLGTLGSGNHFIEFDTDESDRVWIVIHSGSRNLGHKVASHYMKAASNSNKAKEGHYPLEATSDVGKAYLRDMQFCQEFALKNRTVMLKVIEHILKKNFHGGFIWSALVNRNHNHAEYRDGLWIHRKGATQADARMMGVIPGNMRDGTVIVAGKGNPDSLCSSSHGAGRTMSRSQARKTVDLQSFRETMGDIKAKVEETTLDEAPFVYKDFNEVLEAQEDLIQIIEILTPFMNIKA